MRRALVSLLLLPALVLAPAAPSDAAKAAKGQVKYSAPYANEREFNVGQCPVTDVGVVCDVQFDADKDTGRLTYDHRIAREVSPVAVGGSYADTVSGVYFDYTPRRDLATLTVTAVVAVHEMTSSVLPGSRSSADLSLDVRDYVTEPCCSGAWDVQTMFSIDSTGGTVTVEPQLVTLTAELWNAKAGVPLQVWVGLYGQTSSGAAGAGESVNRAATEVLSVQITPGK